MDTVTNLAKLPDALQSRDDNNQYPGLQLPIHI